MLLPELRVDGVDDVDERGVAEAVAQQRLPAGIDGPGEVRCGHGRAQSRDGRESVQDVAHGTDTEDEKAHAG